MDTPPTTGMENVEDDRPCVLVVDDAPAFLEFMTLLLTAEGYRVETASSVAAASVLIAAVELKAIICDVRLPDAPPFAMLDLLQADVATRHLPVMLCTGAVREVEDRAVALAASGVEVVLKPFDIEDLLSRLAVRCPPGPPPDQQGT